MNSTFARIPSTVNRQPSTVNRQPSTVNRQPSTVNRQPSTVNRQPSTDHGRFSPWRSVGGSTGGAGEGAVQKTEHRKLFAPSVSAFRPIHLPQIRFAQGGGDGRFWSSVLRQIRFAQGGGDSTDPLVSPPSGALGGVPAEPGRGVFVKHRRTVNGQRSTVNGQRSTVNGERSEL